LSSVQESSAERGSDAELGRELEAELEDYPDERREILSEAAEAWHRAGEHDRALELLGQAVALEGDEAGHARVDLADVLFDLGRIDEAREQLAALRRDRPSSAGPYHLAGELLEERGEYQEALVWFNMAYSRLSANEISERGPEWGLFCYAGQILTGRRRVREAIGIPPDELDDSVPEPESLLPTPNAFADEERLRSDPAALGSSRPVRVLFWPRGQIPAAHERWPELVEHTDTEVIYREREGANRELAETGYTRISMVPLSVAKLSEFAERTGRDPRDEATRHACMSEIAAAGEAISWPPGRNEPCWCGSGRKYKKCCGRPTLE
jgi:tetratricopeptide (TPR) repeat protein